MNNIMAIIEAKDLLGLSEPLKKFVAVVSVGVGKISESYLIRKNADARAYEIKVVSRAILENQGVLKKLNYDGGNINVSSLENDEGIKDLESTLAGRALLRNAHTEAIKQINIETISQIASEQLKEEKTVSGEKVDDAWTHRFFDIAGEISDEELQTLWGNVLAGEIKQPKSYSLRTLEILKNLTKQEADIFLKYAKIALWVGEEAIVFNPNDKDFLQSNFNITLVDRLLMEELGLLNTQINLSLNFEFMTNGIVQNLTFINGDNCLAVERFKDCPAHSVPVIRFTKIGMDLLRLIPGEAPEIYFEKLASIMKSDKSTLRYGKIISKESNGMISFKEIKKF